MLLKELANFLKKLQLKYLQYFAYYGGAITENKYQFVIIDKTFLYIPAISIIHTVKSGVLFRLLLRHRNSASARVASILKSVCLNVKKTLR
jgi:hypothetical protein